MSRQLARSCQHLGQAVLGIAEAGAFIVGDGVGAEFVEVGNAHGLVPAHHLTGFHSKAGHSI